MKTKPDSIVQVRVRRTDLARICVKLESLGRRPVHASEIVQAAVETVAESLTDVPPMSTEDADDYLTARLRSNLNPGSRAIKGLINNLLMPKSEEPLFASEIKQAIKRLQEKEEKQ